MSLQYEESVLDFDLDFFHQTQTSNSAVTPEKLKDKNEKCRLAINVAKRKIVATDSLIRKYYNKKDELDQLEKTLYTSKEECKKVCIDFQNVTERCNRLDAEAQVLRNINQQLQDKCVLAESRVDALQSHAHQLQTLVKENETLIEGMKVESQLEKTNIKDYEKKFSTHQKENDILMKHIYLMKDVILGKRKLTKTLKGILHKYKNKCESDDNDSVLGGMESDDDNYFESPKTPEDTYKEEPNNLATQTSGKDYVGKIESGVTKSDNDLDSDFSHERASADTGRGSSLAYSDSDKCFQSPDYFMENSPLGTNIAEKNRINVVDVATSPIPANEFVNTATSPMTLKQSVHAATSPLSEFIAKEPSDSPRPKRNQEIVSGITPLTSKQFNKIGENIVCADTDENVSDEEITDSPMIFHEYRQKECLELNNSKNFKDLESRDGEVELILSKMRMTHSLVTPIPTTPSKSQHFSSSCTSAAKDIDLCIDNFVCKDALKVKEENVNLKANIMKLASEIDSIKEMLKSNNLLHQPHPKLEKTIESDYCDEDLILLPEEENCAEISESPESIETMISIPWNENQSRETALLNNINSIPWNEDQPRETALLNNIDSIPWNADQCRETALLNNIDSRKGIKRLEFEEPILYLQNDLSSQRVQEKEFEEEEDTSETNHRSKNIKSSIRRPFRRLTKLDRLRQKLIPKNKIKNNSSPRRRIKNKQVRKINTKAAAALKNKNAYEKAVKIISELKLKGKKVNPNVVKNVEKQSLKKNDILDDILGLEISSKTPIAVPTPKENTSCKELNQESLQDQQHTSKQSPNRIIILEDILLTKQNVPTKELAQQTPLPKSYESIHATTTKTLPNEMDVLKNSSQCVTIQQEKNKQLPIDLDDSKTQDYVETESTHHADQTKVCQEIDVDMENTKSSKESQTKINNEDSNKTVNKPNVMNNIEQIEFVQPCRKLIATRSRTKVVANLNQTKDTSVSSDKVISQSSLQSDICLDNSKDTKTNLQQRTRKGLKRMSVDKPDFECKRMLRSSTSRFSSPNGNNKVSMIENLEYSATVSNTLPVNTEEKPVNNLKDEEEIQAKENVVNHNKIELSSENSESHQNALREENNKPTYVHPKDSILCAMIDKYGKQSMKDFSKKVPDNVINTISITIEHEITAVIDSSSKDAKQPMNKFVETIEKWDYRQFIAGLMNYLQNPQRKIELFNKVSLPSVPPMTKAEQILLYVIPQLQKIWTSIDVVDYVLRNIEYVLFKLNRTPEFDIIESMSHFYAITCRYFKMKSRLRVFMLDAMYCIQFKAIPVIKQCMEVWMHVLPLAHMGIAKNPLVTCMVYLLHFYKCDDKFNRVQDIRHLLSRKYFYEITEWNDAKIIEMFRNAIKDVRVIPLEMKLLRIALIVIAKRYGPQWCQKHIIKSLLLPMIESDTYNERVKVFCVSVLGALLKPYPVDMRVHYEIVMNMLLDMLDQNPSPKMEEAIFTSLIYMSRHNYNRVVQILLTWKPQQISPEFENVLRDFVSGKSLKTWKAILCKISVI